jgi:hypothetical protein
MAIRVLRPPLEIEVLTGDGDAAPPGELRSLSGEGADRRPRLDGRVEVASGPWALEERWWTDEPVDREYWDIELAGGGLFRIFRDNATGRWFADGVYD